MPYEVDFAVFIGRFQPFHNGHLRVIRKAVSLAKHVIVLVGSAKSAPSLRNPFSFEARSNTILSALSPAVQHRVHITPLLDYMYRDNEWIAAVQASVQGIVAQYWTGPIAGRRSAKIMLVGHQKDSSGYYMKLFPTWGAYDTGSAGNINATDIRMKYFALDSSDMELYGDFKYDHAEILPRSTIDMLDTHFGNKEFEKIAVDHKFAAEYKAQWAKAPYPPTFVTVDAVVFQAGHVLMVRRGAAPGKGVMALPGGFVNQDETLRDAMYRELIEETGLKIPPALVDRAQGPFVFDDPHRSIRGRTITHAFGLHLKETKEGLPKVRGGDDADKALWMPIASLDPVNIFEDHYHIIYSVINSTRG